MIGGTEMAEIDAAAQRLGLSQDALMEAAGAAVSEVALTGLVGWRSRRGSGRRAGRAPDCRVLRPGQQRRRWLRGGTAAGRGGTAGGGGAGRRRLEVGAGGHAAAHNWTLLQAMASAGSLDLFVAPSPQLLLELRARLSPAA